jgi:hypothetical protein
MTNEPPSGVIRGLPAPASELPWSAHFVMQAIEVLPVMHIEGALLSLQPEHAPSFIVGWPAGQKPEQIAVRALARLNLRPLVLHSTSWRHSDGEVVLTYLAVVPADSPTPDSWQKLPVERKELARGGVETPPPVIGVSQVLEHALRHLAWLLRDDKEIAAALRGWERVLGAYIPEPFRALGGPD